MDTDKEDTLTPSAQVAISDAAKANVNAAVEVAKSAVTAFVDVLTGEPQKPKPGRKRRLREPEASGARRRAPLLAGNLYLRQVAKRRENLLPSGGPALAPPPRPAGPLAKLRRPGHPESLLKQNESPLSQRPQKLAGAPLSRAKRTTLRGSFGIVIEMTSDRSGISASCLSPSAIRPPGGL